MVNRIIRTVSIAIAAIAGAACMRPATFSETYGCEYGAINIERHGLMAFEAPPTIRSSDGELNIVLDVKYGTYEIAGCQIRHRSYNGQPVGPTLRLKPGDTLNMLIRNQLPPNPDPMPADHNTPHHFNTTNVHTHGLHVDPNGISDNVLRKMTPGTDYQVRVEIPEDHPPGTFWYHPHVHGSTAIQVSSGMGGALVIEGGLDDIPEIAAAKEQVFMFQQVAYDNNGEIEDFLKLLTGRKWQEVLKRHTTINGQLVPVITLRPGEVRRWRFVHAGVKESLMVRLEGHKLHEIATDGIALGKCDAWPSLALEPGYRSDVLVKANDLAPGQESAEYWLRDETEINRGTVQRGEDSREFLAKLVVAGEPADMELPCGQGQLAGLVPFAPITDDEIEGTQEVVFSLSRTPEGVSRWTIDGKSFGEGQVRVLKLGSADEWTVLTDPESIAAHHPFHIHVNPFQVTRLDPDGSPEIVWKDTLMIVQGQPQKLRSRYVRYSGRFVLHCHFLQHEDQGMMQVVEILE